MKRSLISSVVISGIVGLSSAAFASTPIVVKSATTPVKVESKIATPVTTNATKKLVIKPVVKSTKSVKTNKKVAHTTKKAKTKLAVHSTKKH